MPITSSQILDTARLCLSENTESEFRSVISRVYYSMLHESIGSLTTLPHFTHDHHKNIVGHICSSSECKAESYSPQTLKSLGLVPRQWRDARDEADYDLTNVTVPKEMGQGAVEAAKIYFERWGKLKSAKALQPSTTIYIRTRYMAGSLLSGAYQMVVSDQTRSGDPAETFKSEQEATKNQIRAALPGIIQPFDPDAVTVVVQPAIRYVEIDNDDNRITKNCPLLVDVPVVFPRGGGCTLTFLVKSGDECLVIFADRCVDFWRQNGRMQEPVDGRVRDSSDAFCIVGSQSRVQKISGISTGATQLRSDGGSMFFEPNPTMQKIKIVTFGGLEVATPLADSLEKVTTHGLLSRTGGMVGSVVSGAASKTTGVIESIGTIKASGKSIDDRHTHGGVQHGAGNTDGVN